MFKNLTCKKVSSLLSMYIDNQLSDDMEKFVAKHLETCNICKKNYENLKDTLVNMRKSYKKIKNELSKNNQQVIFRIKEHETFYKNISPYMDNELSIFDKVQFEEHMQKSIIAKKNLELYLKSQNLIQKAFEKKQKSLKKDFSFYILKKLDFKNSLMFFYMYKVAAIFFLLLFAGFLYFHSINFDFGEKFANIINKIDLLK